MKALLAATIIITLAIAVPLASGHTACAAPDELLQNGGFEAGSAGWKSSPWAFGTVYHPIRSGSKAAGLISDNLTIQYILQSVAVQAGASYTCSGWALKDSPAIKDIELKVCWYDGLNSSSNQLDCHPSTSLTKDSPEYRYLELSGLVAPATARSAEVQIVLHPESSDHAAAYFDDMSFEGPPPPIPATSTPTPTANATATAGGPALTPTPTATHTAQATPTTGVTAGAGGTTAGSGDVLINEVQYNPPQPGPDAQYEWFELFNPTGEAITLAGWSISDNCGSDLIPSIALPPGGFAVVAATEGFYVNYPHFEGNIVFIEDGEIGNGLSNDGDCLILKDSAGTVIDAISYGDDDSAPSPPCPGVAAGHSIERLPAGGSFIDNAEPTPGYGLRPPGATPTPTAAITANGTRPSATSQGTCTSSPTAADTAPTTGDTQSSPGTVLRAVLIAAALVLFGAALWLEKRRRRSSK